MVGALIDYRHSTESVVIGWGAIGIFMLLYIVVRFDCRAIRSGISAFSLNLLWHIIFR